VLAFLKLIPLKDYLWAAAVAALLSYHFYTVHEAKVHASAHELAVLKDSSDKLVKANEEKLAAITQQHTADLTAEKVQHAKDIASADANSRDSAQRLRDADAYRRANEKLARASAGPGSCSQYEEINRRLELSLSSLEQVALGLSSAGNELRASLDEVNAERSALTGK
jgi:hypothetical protein